ncbi:hypothetical protein BDU57DRAFT_510260 [Ampelomyces quisqualis]|uniref:Uncharacterized protein n=1 Tax=Ampelomyces quisqualis TaxID=50730 RepID=A0A6A5R1B9_AMPQU|nr:hypothetical protein BDU57DRAFT_510260 [Ampelomyces quisqualis]
MRNNSCLGLLMLPSIRSTFPSMPRILTKRQPWCGTRKALASYADTPNLRYQEPIHPRLQPYTLMNKHHSLPSPS